MLSRITKAKLGLFIAITVVALSAMALNYVRVPQQVGIGRYGVDVDLAAAGGLYPQATVTYRGVEVGKVTDVELRPGGEVSAHLEIDNGVEIPVESMAEVRSASVIGEQYVNFVPLPGRTSGETLEEGARIPVERTKLPTTTNTLLTSLDSLLDSIPLEDLRTVVSEAGDATRGAGADLGQLIESSHEFQQAASENLPTTVKLLEDLAPVLRTQRALDPEIRSYAGSLASFAGAVEDADSQLRGVLEAGAPFMREVGGFADELRPVVPGLLSDVAGVGQVANVYRRNIEHVLIVAPAAIQATLSSIPPNQRGIRSAANLWFKLGVDPPPCTVGFRDADQVREPANITTVQDPSRADWCKVPTNDVRAARGARNAPCPQGGRAATAAGCGLVFDGSAVRRTTASGGGQAAGGSFAAGLLPAGSESNPATLADLLKGFLS